MIFYVFFSSCHFLFVLSCSCFIIIIPPLVLAVCFCSLFSQGEERQRAPAYCITHRCLFLSLCLSLTLLVLLLVYFSLTVFPGLVCKMLFSFFWLYFSCSAVLESIFLLFLLLPSVSFEFLCSFVIILYVFFFLFFFWSICCCLCCFYCFFF